MAKVVKIKKCSVQSLKKKLRETEISLGKEMAAKELLENIIGMMPGHVYWLDRNNVYLGCNDLQATHVGLKSRQEIVGKRNKDLSWKDEAASLDEMNTLVLKTGKLQVAEEPATIATGLGTFLSYKAPLRDKAGKIIGVVGISVDITDRKKAERLQIEKEAAEQNEKILEMLAGNIAHELRTPLSIININADNLKLTLNFLAATAQDTSHIQDILKNVTNIKSAIRSGKYAIDVILSKIRSVANKTSAAASNLFSRYSIAACTNSVLSEYPFTRNERELVKWEASNDYLYFGDEQLTKHIIYNLLKNSLYFIQHASKGTISISLRLGDKFNYLIFKDTAAGIPADILPNIFNQFFTTRKDGTGLGLAFCKMVMQSYGGDIICNSQEKKFTEFVLSFPKVA